MIPMGLYGENYITYCYKGETSEYKSGTTARSILTCI